MAPLVHQRATVFPPPPVQVGGCSSANRLHVGAAVAAALERLPTAEGEEPQELPARSADLGQGQLPGPPGAESEEPRTVPVSAARLGPARPGLAWRRWHTHISLEKWAIFSMVVVSCEDDRD